MHYTEPVERTDPSDSVTFPKVSVSRGRNRRDGAPAGQEGVGDVKEAGRVE